MKSSRLDVKRVIDVKLLYSYRQAFCGKLSGNELTRSLTGNIRPQSSQLAEPLWTDPGLNLELVRAS